MTTSEQRTRVEPTDPPEALLQLDDRDFYNLVDRDVRARIDPGLARLLRHPVVIERWYQTLLKMKKTVEGTIAAKSVETRSQRLELENFGTVTTIVRGQPVVEQFEDPKAKAAEIHVEFLRWKAGSIRFKVGVEERLPEVVWRRRLVMGEMLHSLAKLERNQFAEEVMRLRGAIEHHRAEIDPDDVTEQDEQLWREIANPIDKRAVEWGGS